MTPEADADVARRRRRAALAAALAVPLVATVGVAVVASAPRSPVVYCRLADGYFGDLSDAGNARRAGADEAPFTAKLVVAGDQARAHAQAAVTVEWDDVQAAAARLAATGTAATSQQSQADVDDSLRRLYQDYRMRCRALLAGENVPALDVSGLGGPPSGSTG